jgi:hypothetical protein
VPSFNCRCLLLTAGAYSNTTLHGLHLLSASGINRSSALAAAASLTLLCVAVPDQHHACLQQLMHLLL